MTSRNISLGWIALLMLTNVANTQTKPPLNRPSYSISCSNIVALSGNVNINCSNLTVEQKKLLGEIPSLLHRILSNQDPKAIMEKLDQILEVASRPAAPSVAQNNSGGINVQQATAGNNSSIINSPVSIGQIPKSIPHADMVRLTAVLQHAPNKCSIRIQTDQWSAEPPFTRDLYNLFKDGGWPMGYPHVENHESLGGPIVAAHATIIESGEPPPQDELVSLNGDDPVATIAQVLTDLGYKPKIALNKDVPKGTVFIDFSGQFTN